MKNRLLKSKSHANRYMIETCLNLLEKWEKFQPMQQKSSKWYFILVISARDGEKLCSISGDSQIIRESWQKR